MAEDTRIARQGVKLAVLGEAPRWFDLETAPTLGALLTAAGVPSHMDVRLNHTVVEKSQMARMPLQEGDLVVCVPRIEGGR